jgi:hypothetical protein
MVPGRSKCGKSLSLSYTFSFTHKKIGETSGGYELPFFGVQLAIFWHHSEQPQESAVGGTAGSTKQNATIALNGQAVTIDIATPMTFIRATNKMYAYGWALAALKG